MPRIVAATENAAERAASMAELAVVRAHLAIATQRVKDRPPTTRADLLGLMFDLGLANVENPVGRGGLGVSRRFQSEVNEVLGEHLARLETPQDFASLQAAIAIPALLHHASREMLDRLLRRMYTREDTWCQLFSEPGAGSDLAGLATRAARDGENWRIEGQKVWTTLAHRADRGLLLARTNPDVPKHQGITAFAVDMATPGIQIRPLRSLTGDAEFNEVFFDGAVIPDRDRVGEIGAGWTVATSALSNERVAIGGSATRKHRPGGGALREVLHIWEERKAALGTVHRDRVVQSWILSEVLKWTNQRANDNRRAGRLGPEGSIAKLMFAEANQRHYELCVDMLGAYGQVDFDYEFRVVDEPVGYVGPLGSGRQMFLRSRANSIEGGTSEVQRTILGERLLGLPGEPRAERGRSWADDRRPTAHAADRTPSP